MNHVELLSSTTQTHFVDVFSTKIVPKSQNSKCVPDDHSKEQPQEIQQDLSYNGPTQPDSTKMNENKNHRMKLEEFFPLDPDSDQG